MAVTRTRARNGIRVMRFDVDRRFDNTYGMICRISSWKRRFCDLRVYAEQKKKKTYFVERMFSKLIFATELFRVFRGDLYCGAKVS